MVHYCVHQLFPQFKVKIPEFFYTRLYAGISYISVSDPTSDTADIIASRVYIYMYAQ